jgi:hypothetical protein
MPKNALLTVLGHAALDPTLLQQLKNNPVEAAKTVGIHLTQDEVEHLKKVNFEGLKAFGEQVDAKKLAAIVDKKDL